MLFRLLTLPVSAPLDGVMWVGRKLQETAERELNDVEALKRELTRLSDRLDRGEMSEADFEEREVELIQRLESALKHRSGKAR